MMALSELDPGHGARSYRQVRTDKLEAPDCQSLWQLVLYAAVFTISPLEYHLEQC